MAGVVLQTLSNKKLATFCLVLLAVQAGFFLSGGLIAPRPANVQQITMRKCLSKNVSVTSAPWYFARPPGFGRSNCVPVDYKDSSASEDTITFAAYFPLVRESTELPMSRWFQYMFALIELDVEKLPNKIYPDNFKAMMQFDVKLGYRDTRDDSFTMIMADNTTRTLECRPPDDDEHLGSFLQCDVINLFELGSVHHNFYLVNLRMPTLNGSEFNAPKPSIIIRDLQLTVIHQNGGFTAVWFAIKTLTTPFILIALIWFYRRLRILSRPANLLEKALLLLGCALTLLNLPVEWFSLAVEMPFMLLYADVRQGVFFTALLSFWVIFCGEHMMDQVGRKRLSAYRRELAAVLSGCFVLFVFDLCERGIQLANPFHSVWTSSLGRGIAITFIVLAGIAGGLYVLFLLYMIYKVVRNISAKRTALPAMGEARRRYYSGLIYRFNVLTIATFFCALLTVTFYIVSQLKESGSHMMDDEEEEEGDESFGNETISRKFTLPFQHVSAFLTGVYGMWNVYVFALLVLFAPSHKRYPGGFAVGDGSPFLTETDGQGNGIEEEESELVEFRSLPTEHSALAALTKPSLD